MIISTAILTAALALSGQAAGAIILGDSIAGGRLGASAREVQTVLGPPLTVRRWKGALGSIVARMHYPRLDVDIETFKGRRVVARVMTTRTGERTRSHLGVGSTEARLKHALPGAKCFVQQGAAICRLGNPNVPTSRVTTFFLSHGLVARISVELAINA